MTTPRSPQPSTTDGSDSAQRPPRPGHTSSALIGAAGVTVIALLGLGLALDAAGGIRVRPVVGVLAMGVATVLLSLAGTSWSRIDNAADIEQLRVEIRESVAVFQAAIDDINRKMDGAKDLHDDVVSAIARAELIGQARQRTGSPGPVSGDFPLGRAQGRVFASASLPDGPTVPLVSPGAPVTAADVDSQDPMVSVYLQGRADEREAAKLNGTHPGVLRIVEN